MSDPWEDRAPNAEAFRAINVDEAITNIVACLEDISEHNQFIYFDGWGGLGASAVLRSLAEHPPPSLRNKFDTTIHIDCSKWKNRRTLQRKFAQALKLPQHVMDILDGHDEADDFAGVDEGSRGEIREVGRVIHQAMLGHTFLVVFQNGTNRIIDLNDFGIRHAFNPWSDAVGGKVLWTFRGRLRCFPFGGLSQRRGEKLSLDARLFTPIEDRSPGEKLSRDAGPLQIEDKSSTVLRSCFPENVQSEYWDEILLEEAREIARYTNKLHVTPELAATCCRYVLSLEGSNSSYYYNKYFKFNWATHASNYWVCDGIIQDSQQDKAWDIAAALQEEMLIKEETDSDIASMKFDCFVDTRRWIKGRNPGGSKEVDTFSSPPFLHCKTIRFLGLESCTDQPENPKETKTEDEQEDYRWITEFFQSLYVLEICRTDWELTLSTKTMETIQTNIREISIKKGRIWHKKHGWSWRPLRNIHKLRVIAPTSPWETESGMDDDFTDLVKLELLDLTGNSTIHVLPSFSGATALKTLVLDGCTELEHVGPESLPPPLETFSFSASTGIAEISRISMAACARLVNFRLGGCLPKLEELDLSNTPVKTLDLTEAYVPYIRKVILLGCKRLRSVLWPKSGRLNLMELLYIDTRGGGETIKSKMSRDSLIGKQEEECKRSSVYATDIRFLQSLMPAEGFFMPNLNICLSCTSKENANSNKEEADMGPCSTGQIVGSTLHKSLVPRSYQTYSDVNFDKETVDHDEHVGSSAQQFEPLGLYLEIGGGIRNSNVVTEQGMCALISFINIVGSLLVHDNSSISTVITKDMMSIEVGYDILVRALDDDEEEKVMTRKMMVDWSCLKWCRVERCPQLDTVFLINNDTSCFHELGSFWGQDLLMARCIWSKGRPDHDSFAKLKMIHLNSCPRLTIVLPLSCFTLSSLETIHIVYCDNLSQVFPVEAELLMKLSTDRSQKGVLEFPKLKNIYLHELPKLHQICEAKIFAPELQNIWVRGCWSLKRLPATSDRLHSCAIVDCEDWWKNLEWDGKDAGHHPSLFEPRHSSYYKKTLLRSSVLR